MSDLLDLFGDWAHHADGTPYVVQVAPREGEGGWGSIPGDPITRNLPVLFGNRLVRAGDGSEVVASILVYAESEDSESFVMGSAVVIDGTRQTTIIRVDTISHSGLFDYLAVFCE